MDAATEGTVLYRVRPWEGNWRREGEGRTSFDGKEPIAARSVEFVDSEKEGMAIRMRKMSDVVLSYPAR